MAKPLQPWHQIWHAGVRVQETSPPRRKGTVRSVRGTGPNAVIWVGLDGGTVAAFRPAGLTLI